MNMKGGINMKGNMKGSKGWQTPHAQHAQQSGLGATAVGGSTAMLHRLNDEEVAGGPMPPTGFRLRFVTSNGYACSRSHWLKGCVGRLIVPSDDLIELSDSDTIAVDWHISVMKVGPCKTHV